MKNSIIFLLAICLSSCGMFRKIDKQKILVESSSSQQTDKHTVETDQGVIKTKERWTFPAPGLDPVELKPYVMPDFSSGPVNPDELKNALANMNDYNKRLLTALMNSKMGTYEKEIQENKNAAKDAKEAASANQYEKKMDESLKKEPSGKLVQVVVICFALLLLVVTGFVIVLYRKVNAALTAAEKIPFI